MVMQLYQFITNCNNHYEIFYVKNVSFQLGKVSLKYINFCCIFCLIFSKRIAKNFSNILSFANLIRIVILI